MQNAFEQKDTSNSLLSSYGFVSRDHPNSTPRLTGLSQSLKKKKHPFIIIQISIPPPLNP
jgi:hypothetical protein